MFDVRRLSKKVLLICSVLMICCMVGFTQSYQEMVQADNPLVYWRFDNDLVDTMGNVDLSPAVAPAFVDGAKEGSMAFSTNSGKAWAAAFGTVELNGLENFSYEMWINLSGANEGKFILQRIGLGEVDPGQNSLVYNNGRIEFLNTGPGSPDETPYVELPDSTDAWHHLVLVHNYDDMEIIFYLDGQEAFRTGAVLGPFYGGNSDELYIGSNRTTPEESVFDGSLDEVAIYTKALSAAEVTAHYDATTIDDYAAAVKVSEPIVYWRFENNFQDEMGLYNLIPSGMSFVDGVGGAPNKALYGRVTTDAAQIMYDGIDSFSYEFWFNPIGNSAQSYIFFRRAGADQHAVIYAYNPDSLEFFFGRDANNAMIRPLVNIPNNTDRWYHCAVVNDMDASEIRIYIDGELATSESAIAAPGDGSWVAVGGSDQGDNFDGYVDELAFYNYVLTDSQISTHAKATIFSTAVDNWELQ